MMYNASQDVLGVEDAVTREVAMAVTKTDNQMPNSGTRQVPSNPSRKRSVSYPRYTLKQVEDMAEVIIEMGAHNRHTEHVAQKLNYSNTRNGSFVALKATAAQFGIVTGSEGYLSVADWWISAVNSSDPERIKRARQNAMCKPPLYKLLLEDFGGRQLPTLERLTRELYTNQKYQIVKEGAATAAQVFVESAEYAELLDKNGELLRVSDNQELSAGADDSNYQTSQLQRRGSNSAAPQTAPGQHPRQGGSTTEAPEGQTIVIPTGLYRIEWPLHNGQVAYLFVPHPLPQGEKARLKELIGLLLEEPTRETHRTPRDEGARDVPDDETPDSDE